MQAQKPVSDRKYWIDWAKIFGIFLVILGHYTPNYENQLSSQLLYTFHVPLFFIISGYLTKPYSGKISTCIKKLNRRLLYPYFILIAIGWSIEIVCMGGGNLLSTKDIASVFLGIPHGLVNSMWFVFTLYVVKVLHIIVSFLSQKHKIVCYICFSLMIAYITLVAVAHQTFLPRFIPLPLLAIPFYSFGLKFKTIESVIDKQQLFVKIIVLTLLLLAPFAAVHLNAFTDMYKEEYGCSIILFYLFGVLISTGVLMLFKYSMNKQSKLMLTLSEGTLLIVAFHKLVLEQLEAFNNVFPLRVLVCILILLAFYYPIIIAKNYCPILLGKK